MDLIVYGSNFQDSSFLSCLVGDDNYVVTGRWISAHMMICIIPNLLKSMNIDLYTNKISLKVSNNGYDVSLNSIVLDVIVRVARITVSPKVGFFTGENIFLFYMYSYIYVYIYVCLYFCTSRCSDLFVNPFQVVYSYLFYFVFVVMSFWLVCMEY
jgi:hypothetical protein